MQRKNLIDIKDTEALDSNPAYSIIPSINENGNQIYYFVIYIPHFSEHTISICTVTSAQLIETLSKSTALLLYFAFILLTIIAVAFHMKRIW